MAKKRTAEGVYNALQAISKEEGVDFGLGRMTPQQFKSKYFTGPGNIGVLHDKLSRISQEAGLDFGQGSKEDWLDSFGYGRDGKNYTVKGRPQQQTQQTKPSPMTDSERKDAQKRAAELLKTANDRTQQAMGRLHYWQQRGKNPLKVYRVQVGKSEGGHNITDNRNVVEGGIEYNPATGKMEQTYLTQAGNRYFSRTSADTEQHQIDREIERQLHPIESELKDAEAEQERLNNLMRERMEEINAEKEKHPVAEFIRNLADESHGMPGGPINDNGMRDYRLDPRYRQLEAAARKNRQTIQTLRDKKNGQMDSFWHTLGTTMLNGYTFSDGLSDANDAISLMEAQRHVDAINKKRQKGEELTKEEEAAEAVLRNFATDEMIQGMYGGDYGAWAGAGRTFGTSLDFMKDILLTGGGAGAVTKGVFQGVVKGGMKSLSKKGIEKGVKAAIAKGVLKATGIALGTTAGGAMITNTTGINRTMGNAAKLSAGHVGVNENGGYTIEGQKGLLKSFLEAEREMIGENQSEMFGEFIPGGGKYFKKGLEKIGLSRVSNALTNIGKKEWYQQYSRLLEASGWNGLPGEGIEEYENFLFDALTGHGEEAWEQLKDPRTHIDIWLGCATMGALLSFAPTAIQTAQTGQYYRYKHQVNKSSASAAGIIGDRWYELQGEIDGTPNESMADVLTQMVLDPNLNHEQKNAVLDYARNLTKMRGYNIATANNANEEKDPDVELANEAYSDGYNASEPADMQDVKNRMEYLAEEVKKVFGEELLTNLDENPIETLRMFESTIIATEEDKQKVRDYIDAKSAYDGMIQRAQNDIDIEIAHSNAAIDNITHHDGNIHKLILTDGREVYMRDSEIVMTDDGTMVNISATKEKNGGDGAIQVVDKNGVVSFIDVSHIQNVESSVSAEELKQQQVEAIRNKMADEAAAKIDGTLSFALGDKYTLTDESGNIYSVTVVQESLDKDHIIVQDENGKVLEVPREIVQQMADRTKYNDFLERMRSVEELEKHIKDDDSDDGGEPPMADGAALESKATDTGEETAKENAEENTPIPQDKQGNLLYHEAPLEATINDLYDGSMDDEEIRSFVGTNVREAQKKYDKLSRQKPTMVTNKQKYLAERERIRKEQQEAKRVLDYWKDVEQEVKKITHTTDEELAEVQKELSGESARKEYNAINGEDILDNPMSPAVLAGEFIKGAKITPESFKQETGYSSSEQKAFVGMIATEKNGGKTIGRLAEDLVVYDNEEFGGHMFGGDSQEARNAIIEALGGARTQKGLGARSSAKEDAYISEYNRRRDEEYYQAYHLTYEEYLDYREQVLPDMLRKYHNFDEQNFISENINEIEDQLQQRENEIKNEQRIDTTGADAGTERSREVLSGERSNQDRRSTPSTEQTGETGVGLRGDAEETALPEGTSERGEENGEISNSQERNPFEYFKGTIQDLISEARKAGNALIKKIIAPVSARLHADLLQRGLNVDGYNHVLDNNAIRHAIKQHGGENEINRGQLPITDEDFERLPEIVEDYDNVHLEQGKRNEITNIIYSKSYPDGTTIYVEEKRSGRKELAAVTMWKTKNTTLTDANRNATPISDLSDASVGKGSEQSAAVQGKGEKVAENQSPNAVQAALAVAEQETNTEPTEAQKEAGNYKKGHVKIDGYDVTIENPKGSVRRGTDASGKQWEQEMQNTYGYIRGTEGVDGDHIDVFFSEDPSQGDVFVVDQVNKDGSFDEHKVMYGFPDIESARKAYLSNYEDGWQGLGAITPVSKEEFKKWIDSSHRKTKPFAEYSSVKPLGDTQLGGQEKDGKEETTVSPELKSLIDDYNAANEKSTEYINSSGEEYNKTEKEREEAFRASITAKIKLREALNSASQEELEYLKSNGSREVRDMALKEQSKREEKLHASETFDERIKEQGEITGKGSIKPLSKATVDIAEKNEQRPVMGGVYHDPEGYGVVSDGHTLVASKELYDKKNKGKIIAVHELKSSGAKKGEEIKGKYPKWRMVIPKEVGKTAAVNWQHLSNFLAGVTAEMKKRWREAKEEGGKDSFAKFNDSTRIALRMPDGTIAVFRADGLAKFVNAAQQLDAKEIEYTFEDRAIAARGKKGLVLQMPVSSPYDVIHEDNVFFYDQFKATDLFGNEQGSGKKSSSDGKIDDEQRVQELASQLEEGNTAKNDALIQQIADMGTAASERWLDENVRGHKVGSSPEAGPVNNAERQVVEAFADHLNAIGVGASTDWETGQRVLDMVNGENTTLSKAQKRAAETASLNQTEGSPADISTADGAKVLNNLDKLAKDYNNLTTNNRKSFLNDVAKALGAKKHSSNSQYATFETKNGQTVTIRLANHNAKVSTFDNHGEDNGISIVVSKRSNNGITNDGKAHVVEFFYPEIGLRKADGKPLADIVRAIKQSLYSGEFNDPTGIAERTEVNTVLIRQHKVYHGSGADFDTFDHSHMGEGEGAQAYGWGTYVTEVEGIGRTYARSASRPKYKGFDREDLDSSSNLSIPKAERIAARILLKCLNGSFPEAKERAKAFFAERVERFGKRADWTAKDFMDYFGCTRSEAKEYRAESERKVKEYSEYADALDHLNEEDFQLGNGVLYTVEIPDDGEYLDWTITVPKEMRRKIADAVRALPDNVLDKARSVHGPNWLPNGLETLAGTIERNAFAAKEIVGKLTDALGSQQATSELLHSTGFTGIKYPAEYRSGGRADGAKNYVIFDENDLRITDKVKFFRTANGEAYGFIYKGKIYLDPRIATSETPIHEYAHLWSEVLEKANPEAWAHLKEELRKDTELLDYVRRLYPEIKDENELMHEVFAHFSGRKGKERLDKLRQEELEKATGVFNKARIMDMFRRLGDLLKNYWNEARKLFSGNNGNLKNKTAEDFADMVMSDLMNGFNPKKAERVHRDTSTLAEKVDEETGDGYGNNAHEIAISDRMAQREYLLSDNYVSSLAGDEFAKSDKPLTERVAQFYAEKFDGKVEREGLGTVILDKRGVKDSLSHGIGRNKAAAFAAVPDIIRNGVLIDQKENWKNRKYDSYTIAAPIEIAGEGFVGVAIVTRGHGTNTNKFYLHEVVLQKNLLDESIKTDTEADSHRGDVANVLKEIVTAKEIGENVIKTEAFKDWFGDWENDPDEASKVVDESGRPKVVLHGTPNTDFYEFKEEKIGSGNDPGWLGRGFYFYGNNPEYARQYAKGGRVMEVYLNIRNPYYATVEDMERLAEANSVEASREFRERLEAEGYDGVYYNGDLNEEWVAFHPNQIKSATENVGTYDRDNDDVRYRDKEFATSTITLTSSDKKNPDVFAERQWRRAKETANDWVGKLGIGEAAQVYDSIDDVPGSEHFSERKRRAKGWFDKSTGKIVIVIGNNESPADVLKTVLHEAVAHYGLRKLFGKNFDNFLDNVYSAGDIHVKVGIMAKVAELMSRERNSTRTQEEWRRMATEEYLAELAESTDFEAADQRNWASHWFNNIKQLFLGLLKKIGLKNGLADWVEILSDNELRYILWRSYKNMAEPGRYRNVFQEAEDVAMQSKLGVGSYAKHATMTEHPAAKASEPSSGDVNLDKLYQDFKEKHPDALLMFNMGGNEGYRVIGDDRKVIGRVFGMHAFGNDSEQHYNVPSVKLDLLLSKLVRGGFRVGIIDVPQGDVARESGIEDNIQFVEEYENNVENVNNTFNEQLQQQIDGTLPKGHIYDLGMPSDVLLSTGFPNVPIELSATHLADKANVAHHPFSIEEMKDLVKAIQTPMAVFAYGDKGKSQNVIVEIQHDGKNFVVGIHFNQERHGAVVNDIRGLYPKDNAEWLNWITQGKLLYADKEKIQTLIDQQRRTLAEVDYLDLNSVAKIIKGFANPSIDGKEILDESKNADESTDLYRDGDFSPRDRSIARDTYERMVSTGGYQFQEAVQDSMLGLKRLYQSILGKGTRMEDVDGFENAYLAENRMSSVNAAEQHEYYVRFMKPLLKAISDIAGANNGKRQELTDYMMAKHGLERNVVMAQRDFDAYQQQYPKGTKTLDDFRERDYAGLTALTGEDDVAMAESAAQQMIDNYEQDNDTTELWKRVNDATAATLAKIYNSGLLSKERYEQIQKMFEYYIPLQGWDKTTSDEVYGYLTSKNGPLGGSPIKHAKGRSSKADDPIATIALMADDAIRQGNRNKMKQTFLNFVLNHQSDLVSVNDLWLQYNAAMDEWEPVFADIGNTDTAADVERKVEAFEERMQQLAESDPDNYKRGSDAQNIPYKVVKYNLREHQVLVRRNGRTYVLTINGNPRAAQALNGLTNPDVETGGVVGNLLQGAQWFNRNLSAFYTTRNPDFVANNFLRDMLYSNCMTWVKESPKYALRFHKNFGRVNPARMRILLGKWENGTLDESNYIERLFKQFMLNGGETGYTNIKDIDGHKREIVAELKRNGNNVRKAWQWLGEQLDLLNGSMENCARFAAFVTSREEGRSIERSIYDAKEISVNFNKKGSGGKMLGTKGQERPYLTLLLNPKTYFNKTDRTELIAQTGSYVGGGGRLLYVFWNAGVQSTTNFARAAKRNPIKATAGAASMFMLGAVIPFLAQAMSGGDDDDKNAYYNLPEYVRRSNIIINAGNQWVAIPLTIEFRPFYGLGELAAGVITGNERYSDSELAFQMGSQISQILPLDMLEGGGGVNPFIPSAAKPFVEAYIMNKSWTGLPVYKDSPWNKNNPEWTKAYKSANTYLVSGAKWLNDISGGDDYKKGFIDINPAKVEYLLSGMFGGAFTTVDKLVKMGETIFSDREFDWRNMLIANRVVKTGDERTANRKLSNEYFKYKDKYEETKRLLKKYSDEAATNERYKHRLERLQQSEEYLLYDVFDNYQAILKNLHDVKDGADEATLKSIENEENALRREMVDLMHAIEDDKNPDINTHIDAMLRREFEAGGRTRKPAGSRIAKRLGGTDSYGSPQTEYDEVYSRMRDYVDLAEDVMIQAALKKAKERGDTETIREIEKARREMTEVKKELSYTESDYDRRRVMDVIRDQRHEIMKYLGLW